MSLYRLLTTDSKYGCNDGNIEERYVKVALQLANNNIDKVFIVLDINIFK